MMIALVLGLVIYQNMTSKERSAQIYLKELEITQTCEDFLDLIIDNIDNHSSELTLNSKVTEAFENNKLEDNLEVASILNEWILNNTEVKSIHMMSLNGKILSASNVTIENYKEDTFVSQFSKEILQEIYDKAGQIYIGIGNDYVGDHYGRTLYIARRINSTSHLQAVGYMFYFFDYEMLQEKLSEYLERNNFEMILVDQNEHTLNFGASDTLQKTYKKYLKNQLADSEKESWESDYSYAETKSDSFGLQLMGQYIEKPVEDNLINILIAFCIVNLIFLVMAALAIKNIVVTPLEEISSVAKQISEEGILSTKFKVLNKYREASIIAETLNEMLGKIHRLMREAEERERQRRVLELSVISHQVNPHFLFNTLNSVSLLIAVEDKKTALKLVKSLAKYYRACLSQENNINTVEQELAIMREYVHIIELKNPDLIRMSIDVDENMYNKKMPRMIMQTLVENSIKYGIKTMEEPLEIEMHIKADYENDRTILIIRDNGKGMEEEIKQSILQGVQLKDKSGFGLKSTIKRISLLYQIESVKDIINIDSKLDEYTCIKFFIPW